MNFTSTPPSRPGFYAWRFQGGRAIGTFHVTDEQLTEAQWKHWFAERREFCLLLPAEEVEKAFREGMRATIFLCPPTKQAEQLTYDRSWEQSNARKIAEEEV